jgi:hypothetical protein
MSAKDLFHKPVTEAGDVPPRNKPGQLGQPDRAVGFGGPVPPEGRPPRISGGPGGYPAEDDFADDPRHSDMMARMMGRRPGGPGMPPGQFSPQELSQIKDVMIMMLAELAHSDLDKQIGQALMTGQELAPGQLQHILDEARNLRLPPAHGALLQKIFQTQKSR